MSSTEKLLRRVAEVYDWLDTQIRDNSKSAGKCNGCGRCCNFDDFDHRLFVTSPELIYFTAKLSGERPRPMPDDRCPYNEDGKCSIYEHRFVGCRIFCCNADKDFQSRLTESVLKKLKSICEECDSPYHYTDLAGALNNLQANTCLSEGGFCPGDRKG